MAAAAMKARSAYGRAVAAWAMPIGALVRTVRSSTVVCLLVLFP
jgi:hypothetical protein